MHIGLGGLIILMIVFAAVFGGPYGVRRAAAGLGCLAAIILAGVLILALVIYWDYHRDEHTVAPAGQLLKSENHYRD